MVWGMGEAPQLFGSGRASRRNCANFRFTEFSEVRYLRNLELLRYAPSRLRQTTTREEGHHGLQARVGPDPRLRRGPGEGLLRREGGLRCGSRRQRRHRPQGERRKARRTVDSSRLGLLDRFWDRDLGHAAGLRPGPTLGRFGYRGGACGARQPRGGGRRGTGPRGCPVRSLQRSGRERLDLAAAALLAYSPAFREGKFGELRLSRFLRTSHVRSSKKLAPRFMEPATQCPR